MTNDLLHYRPRKPEPVISGEKMNREKVSATTFRMPFQSGVSIQAPHFAGVLLLLTILAILGSVPAQANLTFQGPSGFVQVPSHTTIEHRQLELGFHTKPFRDRRTGKGEFLTSMAMGFSPIRDFEIGIQKSMDSRRGVNDLDPDPTINMKVRLPIIGSEEFSAVAFGMVLDTNPNNYHTMYLTIGGFGVGWNFGGNPGIGTAQYGAWNSDRQRPESFCLLVGVDYPPRRPGERGYRNHYQLDYNGDVFSAGWRFKSHRGFWIGAALQTRSSYRDFYDFRPFIMGIGAIF